MQLLYWNIQHRITLIQSADLSIKDLIIIFGFSDPDLSIILMPACLINLELYNSRHNKHAKHQQSPRRREEKDQKVILLPWYREPRVQKPLQLSRENDRLHEAHCLSHYIRQVRKEGLQKGTVALQNGRNWEYRQGKQRTWHIPPSKICPREWGNHRIQRSNWKIQI